METDVESWMERLRLAKQETPDLSKDEDLSIALMNLISLEEHFYFTAMKTGEEKHLDMLESVREMRKRFLAKLVRNPKGEEWCVSKHLLAASMRLYEVGTKELAKDKREAMGYFQAAFQLYSLFFAINLRLVELPTVAAEVDPPPAAKGGIMQVVSEVIKRIVDCCKE